MPTLILALAAAQAFTPGTPAFDPRLYKHEIAGAPAQVLVLGTPHLSQLPKPLDPKLLNPLLDRLARFKPDVITVEALSGEECETLRHFSVRHAGAWDDYCLATDDIEKATGLSVSAAAAEVDRTLASWPAAPTPGQRRKLATLFLAANERASAMVQWLSLDPRERRAGDGLTDKMVEMLERTGKAPNENYAIGAALAARLGLTQVHQVDDHIADGPDQGPAFGEAIQRIWNATPAPAVQTQYKARQSNLGSAAALLGYYRWLNAPSTQRASIAADMGAAARQFTPQLYGRQYLAWWESRNLRMVANIRSAFAQKPDARVLVIVGSTHKGYFDAYLNMMQDIQLIDAGQFLE